MSPSSKSQSATLFAPVRASRIEPCAKKGANGAIWIFMDIGLTIRWLTLIIVNQLLCLTALEHLHAE